MSINVKNPRVDELVAKLKKQTGKGTTDLLLDLLERENERLEADFQARLREAQEADCRLQDAWAKGSGPTEIDYDENGLPV